MIIGSCIGEDQFKLIQFLEPNDFPDSQCRELFRLIIECKTEDNILAALLSKTEDEKLQKTYLAITHLSAGRRLQGFALKLLERRFERLLSILLSELSIRSESEVEGKLLNDVIAEIRDADIFVLVDGIEEYLGSQASNQTKRRIKDFKRYMDQRINETKMNIMT